MYVAEKDLCGKWDLFFKGENIGYIDFDANEVYSNAKRMKVGIAKASICILKKLILNTNSIVDQEALYSSYSDDLEVYAGNSVKSQISILRNVNGKLFFDCIVTKRSLGYMFIADIKKNGRDTANLQKDEDSFSNECDCIGDEQFNIDSSDKRSSLKDVYNQKPYTEEALPALTTIPPAVELIGREKAIEEIQGLLEKHKIVYIHANGGVGKTAVALEIANQIMDNGGPYNHIAWITSTGNIKADLINLDIPGVNDVQKTEDKYNKVYAFLQTIPTFLVIDNMDDPLLKEDAGVLNTISMRTKILITTRAELSIGKRYELGDLDPDSSLLLFYQHYRKGKDLTIDQIMKQDDKSYAQHIVEEASYNALFIELIAKMAYADHWKLDALWKELKKDVFGKESKHSIPTNHGDGRLLDQIENLYKMSGLSDKQKEIMTFIALFPPMHSIFFAGFEWAGFEDDEVDNLGELERRGWIERGDEGYLIHTLVKGSVQQQGHAFFDEDRYEELIHELADTDQYMSVDKGYSVIRERIVVPETICRLLVEQESEKDDIATLYHNIARVYKDQGNYEKALEYYRKAQVIKEKMLGKEHPSTATTYNNMASVYQDQGNYEKALEYYRKAQVIEEKVLGKEHPSTATTYNNMASLFHAQGNYKKALEYYEKAHVINEKVLGKEHPSTATTYNNIARVYKDQGNYEKALEYYEEAQKIREKVLGKEHPDTANTYNNMALVYDAQGNYEKALEYYRKAHVIYEKVLGKEHPSTATTYNNMAGVYHTQGNYKKALEYYEKALKILEEKRGQEHPFTKITRENLDNLKKDIVN